MNIQNNLPPSYIYHPHSPVTVTPQINGVDGNYSINLLVKVGDLDGGSSSEKIQVIGVDGEYETQFEAAEMAMARALNLVDFIIETRHNQELGINFPDDFDETGGIPVPVM